MSASAVKFREEQILVICPGSRTTMAQLGCNELTPPTQRIPTRMFKDPEHGGWRPYHTFKRRKDKAGEPKSGEVAEAPNGDAGADEEWEWVEDQDSDEGAVYPMKSGRIVNMPAFLAFIDHVHSMYTTTYHNTPIVLMASPQWTRDCTEEIAQYIFEKTKTPALCLIHSAIATQYGLRWPSMTVVDIGFEKVDVTCIFDGAVVNHQALGIAHGDTEDMRSGGEVFTRKLMDLLKDKGFTYDMAEQLKKSNICEVLPYSAESPGYMELPKESAETMVAPGSAGTDANTAGAAAPTGDDGEADEKAIAADGVLDVASIVTSGQTKEFLARREKERDKAKTGKKGRDHQGENQTTRIARLPNSKRPKNVFYYEEVVQVEVPKEKPAPAPAAADDAPGAPDAPDAAPAPASTTEGAENGTTKPEASEGEKPAAAAEEPAKQEGEPTKDEAPESAAQQPKEPESTASAPAPAAAPPAEPTTQAPPRPDSPVETELQAKLVRRDIEVGLERFLFAERAQIDRITTLIWKTIQGVPDMFMRPACWDNIAVVGNGSRVRGLRDNIIQTLAARHLISPSTATMFTSELPSNMATPTGTGSQTPTGSVAGTPHQLPAGPAQQPLSSGVNPLLQAATTAQQAAAAAGGGSELGAGQPSHRFHSQTPTSIRLAPLPTYLAEWSKNGYEEAMFLGAQVAGRIAFCLHNLDVSSSEAQRKMSLSRVEYNEVGPKGIRKHSMLQ